MAEQPTIEEMARGCWWARDLTDDEIRSVLIALIDAPEYQKQEIKPGIIQHRWTYYSA